MQPCRVSFAVLIDYREERLDAAAAQELERHLAGGCEACRQRLTQLRRLMTALGGQVFGDVPARAYDRLKAAYRERYEIGPMRPPLIARPVFDSRNSFSTAMPAGARGGTGDTFQVIHTTAEHEIHLWGERRSEEIWYLIGQVLPHVDGEAIAPTLAVLRRTVGEEIVATADGAEFHLATVPAGTYTLLLRMNTGEIVMPDVTVGV
jgi:hypothetical protein